MKVEKFVVVSLRPEGNGYLMSTPVSREKADILLAHTTKCRGEELKVISVQEAIEKKHKIVGVIKYLCS